MATMKLGGRARVALLILGFGSIIVAVPPLFGFRWWVRLIALALGAVLLRLLVICPHCGKSRAARGWTSPLESACPFCGKE
jgi:hypothetical protein